MKVKKRNTRTHIHTHARSREKRLEINPIFFFFFFHILNSKIRELFTKLQKSPKSVGNLRLLFYSVSLDN